MSSFIFFVIRITQHSHAKVNAWLQCPLLWYAIHFYLVWYLIDFGWYSICQPSPNDFACALPISLCCAIFISPKIIYHVYLQFEHLYDLLILLLSNLNVITDNDLSPDPICFTLVELQVRYLVQIYFYWFYSNCFLVFLIPLVAFLYSIPERLSDVSVSNVTFF